ncbi:MAG: caspase family protein [Gemmataceae bacterium]|nr:caspase family protein [Gemmataceae bacterium]
MTASPNSGAKLHALLIAVDCYLKNRIDGHTYPSLRGCVQDITRVEGFLRRRLGLQDEHLIKLTSTNTGAPEPPEPPRQQPTYENLVRAFGRLADIARPGDLVYIHFSGHGGRTRTLFPAAKGADGLDESLVPLDIGRPEARFLRDLELGHLLDRMVRKGLLVTLVLDSCYAGGATRGQIRGNDVAVRGVHFIDTTPRPPDSLVAPLDELADSWQARTRGAVGGGARRHNWLPEPRDYVLLAACRPHELAHEFAFGSGGQRSGALTWSWLEALNQLGPNFTYALAHDRILARLHAHFPQQTPMLLGDGSRVVFGACQAEARLAVLVQQVTPDGQRVQLQAGQALGVRRGAQLVTYPQGVLDFSRADRRTALLRLTELGATGSWAEVVQSFGAQPIQPGDQAVLLGAGSVRLVRRVSLMRPDGSPAAEGDAPLRRVEQALPGNGWVERAPNGEAADFLVTVTADGHCYEICDPAGTPIPNLLPPLSVEAPDAARSLVERLVHLAKYRAVEELANNDEHSPLRGKLLVELLGMQDDFEPGDLPAPLPFAVIDPEPTLRVGEWAVLRVRNDSEQVLNVAILDLQPGWGIGQVYPGRGAFEALDPHRELVLPLHGDLPAGLAEGLDMLKVFATVGAPNFRTLALPSLCHGHQRRSSTTRDNEPSDPLDRLLRAVSADRPATRSLTPAAVPSKEWTVADVRIRVTRGGPVTP